MNEKLGLTSDATYVDQVTKEIEEKQHAKAEASASAAESGEAAKVNGIELTKAESGEVAKAESGEVEADEVLAIPDNCPSCTAPILCRIKEVSIPHFKSVFIYAHECDTCGHRSNEVRTGGSIAEKGLRFTLKLSAESEWQGRDCLKSSNCSLIIPELDLHAMGSTLGGSFTTVEGLLGQVYNQLENSPFLSGDSASAQETNKLKDFLSRFKQVMDGTLPATLIMEDPAGNSYVQNLYAPDVDPYLVAEQYERSEDDEEALGIADMNVDHYEAT
jgi:zinc finger protein